MPAGIYARTLEYKQRIALSMRRCWESQIFQKKMTAIFNSPEVREKKKSSLKIRHLLDSEKTKICAKCGTLLQDAGSRKSGRCRTCRIKELRNWQHSPKGIYNKYKHNAKLRQLEFDLTLEQLMQFWQKPCFYCGDEITTVGLDRVDSTLGYILNNVVPCCYPCNWMKMQLRTSEFVARCARIAERHAELLKLGV